DVIGLVDELTETARAVGAVNTILIQGDKLVGDNTDAHGFLAPLKKVIDLQGAKAAVLGTGGAARAVTFALTNAKSSVTVFGRRPNAAVELAGQFAAKTDDWNALGKERFDLVVNATPTGMTGHNVEALIPETVVTNCQLFYDLVYNPIETQLMKLAAAAGVKVI